MNGFALHCRELLLLIPMFTATPVSPPEPPAELVREVVVPGKFQEVVEQIDELATAAACEVKHSRVMRIGGLLYELKIADRETQRAEFERQRVLAVRLLLRTLDTIDARIDPEFDPDPNKVPVLQLSRHEIDTIVQERERRGDNRPLVWGNADLMERLLEDHPELLEPFRQRRARYEEQSEEWGLQRTLPRFLDVYLDFWTPRLVRRYFDGENEQDQRLFEKLMKLEIEGANLRRQILEKLEAFDEEH